MSEGQGEAPKAIKSTLMFPVVGIGASAGGLPALKRFFEEMPASPGIAFVIVLHLSPNHESSVAEILQLQTSLVVQQVIEPTPIEPDHVYVIPPVMELQMTDGHLRLSQPTRRKGPHVAIDVFFRTLAEVHRDRAFAIVLSGLGSDGAVGVARIKEQGGVSFAQSPEDAEYDSMPRAAIATGSIDFVMPVGEMPRRLVALWNNLQHIRLPPTTDADEHELTSNSDQSTQAVTIVSPSERQVAERAVKQILATLRSRTHHDFRHYKRATVLRRIERRMQVNGVHDLPAYQSYLASHAEEAGALLQDMLISVTNFFRDKDAFEAVESVVIPKLFEAAVENEPIRVWVPGCATGEEAYSIAMLLREQADKVARPQDIQVFATDIDDRALAIGRAGFYPQGIVADVSPSRLQRFFHKEGEQFRVTPAIRETVLFASHNLLRDPPFSRLHLVTCRNVLIYLTAEAQHDVLGLFRFALRRDGFLFLGSSESADADDNGFRTVDKRARVYRVNPLAPPARGIAIVPPTVDDRSPTIAAATPERKTPSHADWHRRALEQFAPPSLLIDSQQFILHMSPGVNKFLTHGSGQPSLNLIANALPELRVELRTAVFRAHQTGEMVTSRSFREMPDGSRRRVRMSVQPFREPDGDGGYALVTFEEDDEPLPPAPISEADAREALMHDLENEIRQLKTHLQDTIERSDTSTEELKASNEELQAINEELRSASEELETSKEELQSMNEELITVNYELKVKVEETAQINDDLHNLIASTDIAVVFVDEAMRVKRFTPRATDLFLLIPTDVGRSLMDIRHRLDTQALASDAGEAFRTLRPIERELVADDGRIYLSRVLPYRTTANKIEGAVMTFIDITSRVDAEHKALGHEEQLRAATSTHEYAILTMDSRGTILSWNAGAEKMFGFAETETLGKSYDFLFTPEDRASHAPGQELERARTAGRAEDDRWHLRKDGSRVWCSGVTTPYKIGGDGAETVGFAKIARDLTAMKLADARRDEAFDQEATERRAAQSAVRVKDEFLAVMSHELKHPLNLIHVNAELLSRMPELASSQPVRRAAEAIRGAVASQARIIDDLLDLSRARTGKMALTLVQVPIDPIVRRIADVARSDADVRGTPLVLDIEPDVDFTVACDPVRVEQIVWNLVSNAIKFTKSGDRIDVRLLRRDGKARLEVSDTGAGVAKAFLPNVFSMFQQERRDGGGGGMGIGLALVKELAEVQGGWAEAHSEGVGKGATFVVVLPLASSERPGKDAGTSAAETALEGLKVLAVDDMAEVLDPFAELLRLEGADVTEADGGRAALERLAEQRYDLLISDIGMPLMDGYELIDAVRRLDGDRGKLLAIALTGFGRTGDAQRALQVGFDAHLPKPTSIVDLKALVARLRRKS